MFPIPIIMSIYYWYINRKAHKKDFLLVALTILAIFLCIWNFVPLPDWLARISLLYMSIPDRTLVTVTFICVLLLIYCLSNYSTNSKIDTRTKYLFLCLATLNISLGTFVAYYSPSYFNDNVHYMTPKLIFLTLIFFIPITYYCLLNRSSANKVVISILTLAILISGLCIHPLSRGLNIIYEKPLAKEIQKIESEDPDALWFIIDSNWPINDYPAASGADTINSTNYFPNFELYRKIGLENEEQTYNRFAHIVGAISKDPSSLSKIQGDLLILTLNNEDVCKINAKYLLSHNQDLDQFDTEKVDFVKLYDEDHYAIYRANCQE